MPRLETLAGSGASASVHIEASAKPGRPGRVARKIPHPHLASIPAFAEAFQREADLASRLDHPNVVRIYEAGTQDGIPYILMEYVPGPTLRQYLDDHAPLTLNEALDLTSQILRALGHAHEHGITHGDLKPQNFLLAPGGVLKVTDFGLARATAPSSLSLSTTRRGTPYYLAPEQAASAQPDMRRDLYSVGCILYEMLTGRVPFEGEHPWEVIRRHQTEEPPTVRTLRRDVPADVEAIIRRAMAKDPRARYPSPAAMLADIERVREGAGLSRAQRLGYEVIRQALRAKLAYERRQRLLGKVALASLVVAMLGMGAYGTAWAAPQLQSWWGDVQRRIQDALVNPPPPSATPTITPPPGESPEPLPPGGIDPQFYYQAAEDALREGEYAEAAAILAFLLREKGEYRDAEQLLTDAQRSLASRTRAELTRSGWLLVLGSSASVGTGGWSGSGEVRQQFGELVLRSTESGSTTQRSLGSRVWGDFELRIHFVLMPRRNGHPEPEVSLLFGESSSGGLFDFTAAHYRAELLAEEVRIVGRNRGGPNPIGTAIVDAAPLHSHTLAVVRNGGQIQFEFNGEVIVSTRDTVLTRSRWPVSLAVRLGPNTEFRLQYIAFSVQLPTPTPRPTPTATATATPTPAPTPTPTHVPGVSSSTGALRVFVHDGDIAISDLAVELRTGPDHQSYYAATRTDGSGIAWFPNLPPGSYATLAPDAFSRGYVSYWYSLPRIEAGQVSETSIDLVRERLQVVYPSDGATIGDAKLTVRWNPHPQASRYEVQVWDQNGPYSFYAETGGTELTVERDPPRGTPLHIWIWAKTAAGNELDAASLTVTLAE